MGNHKLFLLRAIEIASDGLKKGGGPFGAVVTQNDKIISESYNKVILTADPTAHAEVLAIAEDSGFSDKLIYEEIVLDPDKRKISFLLLADTGANKVFRKWDSKENKIPY